MLWEGHAVASHDHQTQHVALLKSPPTGVDVVPCVGCRLYNIGSPVPHSISQMLDLLERFLERKAVRQKVVLPPSEDLLQTAADISAAKQDLGYRPKVRLGAIACIE